MEAVVLISGGLKQAFGSRPDTEVKLQQWEHQILATRPLVSDNALALQLCREESPQRREVVKQAKYTLGGKEESSMCGQTQGQAQRKSRTVMGVYITCMGHFFLVFLWPDILICLVRSPYVVHLRILPCVHTHLLAKTDSPEEVYGSLASVSIIPLLTSEVPSCAYVVGAISWLQDLEKCVVSCLLSG